MNDSSDVASILLFDKGREIERDLIRCIKDSRGAEGIIT